MFLTISPANGYRVVIPELPIYDLPLKETTVKTFAEFIYKFLLAKNLDNVIVLGNSLGGHIGLVFSKTYPGNGERPCAHRQLRIV